MDSSFDVIDGNISDEFHVSAEDFAFIESNGVVMGPKRRKKIESLTQSQFETFKIGVIISACCRKMDIAQATEAYHDGKSRGIILSNESCMNLLSLVAGLGDQGSGLAQPRDIVPPSDLETAIEIFRELKADENIRLNEASYTAMIRCYSCNSRPIEALELYREMQNVGLKPRMRTFTPMLAAFSKLGMVSSFVFFIASKV